jgi:hypothetical protein
VIGVAKHVASDGIFYLIMAAKQGISYKILNKRLFMIFKNGDLQLNTLIKDAKQFDIFMVKS